MGDGYVERWEAVAVEVNDVGVQSFAVGGGCEGGVNGCHYHHDDDADYDGYVSD